MIVWDFLRWMCSNSGAIARNYDTIGPTTTYVFTVGKHPLTKHRCRACRAVYWAFTKRNYYCGQFKCWRKLHAVHS